MAYNLEESSGLTAAFGSSGFATSGAGNTNISTSTAISYAVAGGIYAGAIKAAAAAAANDFATGVAAKPISGGQGALIVFGFDTSGNLQWTQGLVVPYTNQAAGSTEFPLPSQGLSFAPIAYVIVKNKNTSGTAPWTMGSSFWNAANVSVETPIQVCQLPNFGVFNAAA